jgi:uncharacterized protein (DUF58 family)
VRDALASLTTRGRAFLAAGGTAFACAVVLGYPELVRVGALLAAVPLVAAWFLGRSRYRLGLVRTVSPAMVAAGQQARVTLELTNDGRVPTGLLLLEDQIPYVLGSRPRFVVDRMAARWKRKVSYPVRSEVRGQYQIGPMRVRLSDPFGMVELDRAFQATSTLTVTPRVTPLPLIPLSGAWTGSGDNRPRAFASGSAEDVTVREYRRGDDLRRVHWRSSAHSGELMVRREEQPWQSRATLFLDNRKIAHRGSGAGSSLEHAVSFAAAIGVQLVQRGFQVRFVTATGEETSALWHEHGAAETAPLLQSLAVVKASAHPHLDATWLTEGGHPGLVVAVLGAVADHDHAALVRMRHSAANAMAVVLDVAAWGRGTGPATAAAVRDDQATDWLTGHGWRAVSAGPGDPLPAVWEDLGVARRGAGGGRTSPSGPLVGQEAT